MCIERAGRFHQLRSELADIDTDRYFAELFMEHAITALGDPQLSPAVRAEFDELGQACVEWLDGLDVEQHETCDELARVATDPGDFPVEHRAAA